MLRLQSSFLCLLVIVYYLNCIKSIDVKFGGIVLYNSAQWPIVIAIKIVKITLFISSLLTSQIRIRVGEYDFSSVSEQYPYVERGVARKAVHPKYNFYTYEYDLALVKLDSAVQFAPHIAPICLPATDDLLVGENATVTGWGRLSEGGVLPSVLQEVWLLFSSIKDSWKSTDPHPSSFRILSHI